MKPQRPPRFTAARFSQKSPTPSHSCATTTLPLVSMKPHLRSFSLAAKPPTKARILPGLGGITHSPFISMNPVPALTSINANPSEYLFVAKADVLRSTASARSPSTTAPFISTTPIPVGSSPRSQRRSRHFKPEVGLPSSWPLVLISVHSSPRRTMPRPSFENRIAPSHSGGTITLPVRSM